MPSLVERFTLVDKSPIPDNLILRKIMGGSILVGARWGVRWSRTDLRTN